MTIFALKQKQADYLQAVPVSKQLHRESVAQLYFLMIAKVEEVKQYAGEKKSHNTDMHHWEQR